MNTYYLDINHYNRLQYKESKPYLVVALDILGFSSHVMKDTSNRILFDGVFWITSKMKTIEERAKARGTYFAKFFSDCIFMFFPIDYQKTAGINFLLFIYDVAEIIEEGLINEFLIRGGIGIGECVIQNDMMWGPGIIKAHVLEDKIAGSARIVIERRDKNQLVEYLNFMHKTSRFSPEDYDASEFFFDEIDDDDDVDDDDDDDQDNENDENCHKKVKLSAFDFTRFFFNRSSAELEIDEAFDTYRKYLHDFKEKLDYEEKDNPKLNEFYNKMSWHINHYNIYAHKYGKEILSIDTV